MRIEISTGPTKGSIDWPERRGRSFFLFWSLIGVELAVDVDVGMRAALGPGSLYFPLVLNDVRVADSRGR